MEIVEAAKQVKSGWEPIIQDALPELTHISKLLDVQKKLGTYYPSSCSLFNSLHLCPYQDVKVVMIGYQPHFGTIKLDKMVCKDTGLAFSVHEKDDIPKATKVIFTELKNSIKDFVSPSHGNLESWARQGVLLINNSLTVTMQKNIDVSELWYGFLNKVFKWIKKINPNTIYVLWGRKVQQISKIIPDGAVILDTLSAPDGYKAETACIGCHHFNLINDHLKKHKLQEINWILD